MVWPLSRTTLLVAAILVLALVLRLVEVEATRYRPVNDAGSYLKLASEIAHTGDYSNSHAPGVGAGGSHGPSAYFPPGYPYFLAAVDLIDGHTAVTRAGPHTRIAGGAVHGARISQALLGTLTVTLIGLLAAEGIGELVGLIALALAAIYPVLVGLSGTLVAENLATPLILASVWSALRARRSPRPSRWSAGAGVLAGLAVLAHANVIVLVLPLALVLWRSGPAAPAPGGWRGLAAPGVMVACLLLSLTPWLVRNAAVMHRFIFVTDETGITLVGTYNSASAANRPVPYKWRLFTGIPSEALLAKQARHLTEPGLSDRLQGHALSYLGDHPFAPVAVVFDNSRRLLELEGSSAWRASAEAISLPQGMARAGVISFWILCLLALAGAFTRVARAAWCWLWTAPVLLWLSVAVINAETPRFREPVDAFLIVLAACALAGALRRAPGRLRGAPVAGGGVDPLPGSARQRVEVGQRLT